MTISREKRRAHRKKVLEAKSSLELVKPTTVESPETEKVREKIKVAAKSRSALVKGEGRSMDMEID
jgi:large subunit ribosomal protein L24e